MIQPFERLDDLGCGGLRIIQNPSWFCFGVDAVLLANFAAQSIKKDAEVLDFCCGNGIVPILLSHKSLAKTLTGIEIQAPVAKMAQRSVCLNGIENKVSIVCGDLKRGGEIFGKASFDNITCNPPYKENPGGLKNKSDIITAARHEIFCSLEDIIENAATLLKVGGKLSMVHRPERLADIFCLMRKYKIEPKRLRFVHPSPQKTANMILVEGTRGGRPKLFLDPPLCIHDENGNYTDEINEIYERDRL